MVASRSSYLLTAALLLAALVVVCVALNSGDDGCEHGECGPRTLDLPPSNLRYTGVQTPDTTIALFVDLSSHASRRLFTTVVRAIDQGEVGSAELLLFHNPARCTKTKPYACVAAWAIECAEKQRRGAGLLLAARALDHLWRPSSPDLRNLLDSAEELGLDREALESCAHPSPQSSSPPVEKAHVAMHLEWARSRGLGQTSGGFITRRKGPRERSTPFGESLTRIDLRHLWQCTGIASAATCDQEAQNP